MYAHVLTVALLLSWGASARGQQLPTGPRSPSAPPDLAGVLALSRSEAVDSALARNPQLRAAREQIAQARARVSEATALPDPELGLSMDTENRPFTHGAAGTKELGLGVTIPFPTKLYQAGKAAGSDVDAARFSYAQSRQEIASETIQSYDALLVARRHGENLREAKQLAEDFLQKTQARYNAGSAAGIDVVKAKVEVSRAENDLIANERDVANARAALNRLIGRVLGAPLELSDTLAAPEPIPALDLLERRALEARPEIRGMEAARRGASATASLARQYWLPDVSVSLTKDFADGVDAPYTTEIGFGIPLFFWQHHKGEVAEARHHELELQASSRDLAAQVAQEVQAAHAAASTSLRQVAYLRDELLPEAREAYRIASTSYGLGGSSALEVLDAQRTLLDVESQYTDALGASNDARAQLELAVGAPLDSTSTIREP
ncbi:MAG TPA: TolC family protein [Gemmatimonadaceae bacterium]|nr:TolC family protein [Gemmatimonadaceae bacterium]